MAESAPGVDHEIHVAKDYDPHPFLPWNPNPEYGGLEDVCAATSAGGAQVPVMRWLMWPDGPRPR